MTKEQLARWRAMGFEFDESYDDIAVDGKPEVNIKFVSAKVDDKLYNINLAFTIKNCKSKYATILLKLLPKPLSFLEFGLVKNIEFKGENHTFNFKFDVNPFEPEKYKGEDFIATITCDNINSNTEIFQIAEKKKVEEKKEVKNDCEDKFKKISSIILKNEGGYVDDPADKGGKTNKGISWRTWLAYSKKDLNLEPTVENLKNITEEQASIIYQKRYWEPKGFCLINDLKIALMYYDWTITSGGATIAFKKFLENEYNQVFDPDKKLGESMPIAINNIKDQKKLLLDLTKLRKEYYTFLAYKTNPDGTFKKDDKGDLIKTSDYTFLNAWLDRVEKCLNVKL
jgi:hypothetical protein